MICTNHTYIRNTCSVHEVEVTISDTNTVITLYTRFYLTHDPTYKTTVMASIYVEQIFFLLHNLIKDCLLLAESCLQPKYI